MAKSIRFIGLSVAMERVNPTFYAYGWNGALRGPANDTLLFESMLGRAQEPNGWYTMWKFANETATRAAIINAIDFAATRCAADSTLVIYFAAHGGQVPNTIDAQDDPLDGICLHDGMLMDIELEDLWARFDNGVRIILIADTCSSGTVGFFRSPLLRRAAKAALSAVGRPVTRGMPQDVMAATFEAHRQQYEQYQTAAKERLTANAIIHANVLQMGACEDGAEAFERGGVGAFTRAMHEGYSGVFTGSYKALFEATREGCQPQVPTYLSSCPGDVDVFDTLRAFSPTGQPSS